MVELLTSPWFYALLFFTIAFCYSMVGLGGGSSYTALMVILGFDLLVIPMMSLTLNLFVTTLGCFNFIRFRHARLRLIAPFLVTSIPMAYLGGSLQVPAHIFHWLLLLSLVFVALRIYLWRDTSLQLDLSRRGKLLVALFSGSLLGLAVGVVGIGGGIFLIPLIIILGLGSEKEAAACGVIFIWFNSASGLISRLQHNSIDIFEYTPLIISVIVGGGLGSLIGSSRLPARHMQQWLGVIIIVAIASLIRAMFFGAGA